MRLRVHVLCATALMISQAYCAPQTDFKKDDRFYVHVTTVMNVRSGPNTSSAVVGQGYRGDVVTVLEAPTVEDTIDGKKGFWVRGSIVHLTQTPIQGYVFSGFLSKTAPGLSKEMSNNLTELLVKRGLAQQPQPTPEKANIRVVCGPFSLKFLVSGDVQNNEAGLYYEGKWQINGDSVKLQFAPGNQNAPGPSAFVKGTDFPNVVEFNLTKPDGTQAIYYLTVCQD